MTSAFRRQGGLALLFVATAACSAGATDGPPPDQGGRDAGGLADAANDSPAPGVSEASPTPQPSTGFSLTAASRAALLQLSPDTLPPPPHDASNAKADDPAAQAFGHQLFFDPGFSGVLLDSDNDGSGTTLGKVGESGKVACAGCHIPSAGFVDNRSTRASVSLAAGWGRRRAKPLLDVGQAKIIMWDGRHDALYNQPFEPIEGAIEMNSSRLYAAEQIYKRYRSTYEGIFGAIAVILDDASRFPQLVGTSTGCKLLIPPYGGNGCHGMPGDNAEFDHLSAADQDAVTRVVVNMGKALGAYERLLSCGPSRFDQWMHGKDDALTAAEQRGAAVFVGQREDGSTITGCNSCHSGPYLTDQTFHNIGLQPGGVGPASSFYDTNDHGAKEGLTLALTDPLNVRGKFSDGDDGRLPASVDPAMDGAFRTQSLRCVSKRPSFLHTGQISTLEDAVFFFDRGGDAMGFPGTSENFARHFTPQERADLVAFLKALDGAGPPAQLLVAP